MFDSIDEQMRKDEEEKATPKERWVKWILIGLISFGLFAALYWGPKLLGM